MTTHRSNLSLSSGYASSISASSSSSSSSKGPRKVSSGRGGSGNLVPPSKLVSELEQDAEILQRRKMERSLNSGTKVKYTGRGGTGNIRAAAQQQGVLFDRSTDPDDIYEQLVLQRAKEIKQTSISSTGRGGTGNLLGKTDKKPKVPKSPTVGKRGWRSSNLTISTDHSSGYSSNSSPRQSRISHSGTSDTSMSSPTTPTYPYASSSASISMNSFFSPIPPELQNHYSIDELGEPIQTHDTSSPEGRRKSRWWKLPRRSGGPDDSRHLQGLQTPEYIQELPSRFSDDIETRTIHQVRLSEETETIRGSPQAREQEHGSAPELDEDSEEDWGTLGPLRHEYNVEEIPEDDESEYGLEILHEAHQEIALFL